MKAEQIALIKVIIIQIFQKLLLAPPVVLLAVP